MQKVLLIHRTARFYSALRDVDKHLCSITTLPPSATTATHISRPTDCWRSRAAFGPATRFCGFRPTMNLTPLARVGVRALQHTLLQTGLPAVGLAAWTAPTSTCHPFQGASNQYRSFAAQPSPSVSSFAASADTDASYEPALDAVAKEAKPFVPPETGVPLPPPQMHKGLKRDLQLADLEVKDYHLMQPVYAADYVEKVHPQHVPVLTISQKIGYAAVYVMRRAFDLATGYSTTKAMTEMAWLRRILFLETVAGVPGMVAGSLRHLRSLRSMQKDHGWIHTLLEEAENERMHLLVFLNIRQPGLLFRTMVILAQGVFYNAYFVAYVLSPKTCHNFVGYLEEEAVKTYTHALHEIDEGRLWVNKRAPPMAIEYWKLPKDASMRDVVLAVRADEAAHSYVNHSFAKMDPDADNPFTPGTHQVP